MPALLATELAIWAVALRGGWGRMKALATRDLLRALPRLVEERRRVQATRRIDVRAFAAPLVAELSSPYLGAAGRLRPLALALRLYWGAVRLCLRAAGS